MSGSREYASAARCFVDVVSRIKPEDFSRPGLGEWDVRGLVGHASRALRTVETYLAPDDDRALDLEGPLAYFLTMMPDPADAARRRAQDAAIAERGRAAGEELGDDPAGALRELAVRVLALVASTPDAARIVSPAGTLTLADYLPSRTLELTVHTLDLCRALDLDPPSELDEPVSASLELAGRLAAHRDNRADLLLMLLGRDSPLSAL